MRDLLNPQIPQVVVSAAGATAGQQLTVVDGLAQWAAASPLSSIPLTDAHMLVGNASNVAADVAASGDLTLANTGAFTIANSAVSLAKMADIATLTILGNSTGLSAAPQALTATSARTVLGLATTDSVSFGSVSATTFTGALSGNASTASVLQTARNINGVSFDGSANITVTADASTLTNTTLASNVLSSSLTSFGSSPTISSPTISGNITVSSTTCQILNSTSSDAGRIVIAGGSNSSPSNSAYITVYGNGFAGGEGSVTISAGNGGTANSYIGFATGNGTQRAKIDKDGIFSLTDSTELRLGAANTVSASVDNTVTNKIKMVVGGTTYYLLANTSNA